MVRKGQQNKESSKRQKQSKNETQKRQQRKIKYKIEKDVGSKTLK